MERTKQKNGARSRYYTRYLMHYTKQNIAFLLLGLLFLLGVLAGTFLLRTADEEMRSLLLKLVNGYVEKRAVRPLTENFTNAALSSLIFIAILFVSGFCAIAQPIELMVPLFRGLGYGFSIGSFYVGYGTRAIGYVALYLMPGMMLSSIAMLLCCVESLRLSGSFFRLIGSAEDRKREGYPLQIYLARYIATVFLCLFAALLEAVLYALFAKTVFLN